MAARSPSGRLATVRPPRPDLFRSLPASRGACGSARRSRCDRSRGVRAIGGTAAAEDLSAGLGELLVAEGPVLRLMAAQVVAQKPAPDLAGHGFHRIAGDVLRELAEVRHLVAGERDGDASR